MKNKLPRPAIGVLSICLYLINTAFCSIPILLVAVLKLLVPLSTWRRLCTRLLNRLAGCWVATNSAGQRLLLPTRWEVKGLENLPKKGWYLVVANHQSWVDILALQRIFHGRIPFLKFFLKRELFWYPVLGLCWWALDFPFIKRYSPKFLIRHPHLKGKDIETTLTACKKFSTLPVSVMNFVEGTRFTDEKRAGQQSPYANLLRPRAAGTALVIAGLADKLHRIVDVTIAYPGQVKSFWAFACGRIERIAVHVRTLPISGELIGDYVADRKFRVEFQRWLNTLWREKDRRMDKLLGLPVAENNCERAGRVALQPAAEAMEA